MPNDITILTSRRSYEFPADAIRLTVLSLPDNMQRIAGTFGFGNVGIGTPMSTFAEPLRTLPPGLAFDVGVVRVGEEAYAIRFLHFEARRVVIDVGAPTWVIDHVYQRLREELADVRAPDGGPALGEPQSTLEYSEIVARYPFPPSGWINPRLAEAVDRFGVPAGGGRMFAPTVYLALQDEDDESSGSVAQAYSTMFQFSLRAGTRPDEHMYFTGAPLNSDSHQTFLEQLETAMADNGTEG